MSDIQRINELTDHVLKMQMQEKALNADLKRVKASITQAETELVGLMQQNHMTVAGSALAVAELGEKIVPHPFDWAALHAHIQHTGDFDLLHRRISLTSYNERFQAGVAVPGIEARTLTTVKVSPHG